MDANIQNINTAISAANFVVSKVLPPGAIITAPAAVITQIGSTSLAVSNQSSQAQLFDTGYRIDGSIISLTAKIDGFLLAMGTAAMYGTGGALATGSLLTAGSVTILLTVTAGVIAASANATVRDIITDPEFWESVGDGIDGIDNYLKERSGVSLDQLLNALKEGLLTGNILSLPEMLDQQNTSYLNSRNFVPRYDPLTGW